jgi:hypothetical protein
MRCLLPVWICLFVAAPCAAAGQTRATTGDLRLVAVDETGAAIPRVQVSTTSPDTGQTRTFYTNAQGEALASALPVGSYAVRAEASGFRPISVDEIEIGIGTVTDMRLTLRLASIETSVEVVTTTPLVDVQRSAVSTVISDDEIAALPIDRRNYISFAVLAAGVSTDRTPNQGPAETSGFSVAGQSARSNNITVDGLDNNDDASGGVRAGFSQDAVREYQVVVHSYSAEFGKAAGGVVNIVTKGGGNRVAADVFGFFRDRALNSRGYFDDFTAAGTPVNLPKSPFSQEQYGATLGGPIVKNRTFGFASFERLSIDTSAAVTIDNQTIVPHPFLPAPLGTPAEILRRAGFPVEIGNVPYSVDTTTGLVKIDHALSGGTTLSMRFNVADGSNGNSQPFGRSSWARACRSDFGSPVALLRSPAPSPGSGIRFDFGARLARRALAFEELHHRLDLLCASRVERRAPVNTRDVHVGTEFDGQLHGLQNKRIALGTVDRHPRRPTAHPERSHHRRGLLLSALITLALDVIGFVNDLRVCPRLCEQAHHTRLGEACGEPVRRRAHERRLEIVVV